MNDSVVKEDKYENYLLVEGNDDKHVLSHLLGYHRIPQQFKIKNEHFEIKDHEGIDNLLSEKRLSARFPWDWQNSARRAHHGGRGATSPPAD